MPKRVPNPVQMILSVDCPGRRFLDHVTSRWGVLTMVALADGPRRFFELRNHIGGVSDKMLSQTLKTLCANGLVDRAVDASTPPKVTYSLTTIGASLQVELSHVVDWITRNADQIALAQRRHGENTASNRVRLGG